jgi:DNA ligase-1
MMHVNAEMKHPQNVYFTEQGSLNMSILGALRRRRAWLVAGLGGLGAWLGAVWDVVAQTQPVELPRTGQSSGVLLARTADPDVDPEGFLVSEKFDGVRALWDGRVLRTRTGQVLPAPKDFLARLPNEILDGELWLGRGRFDEVSALVRRRRPEPGAWNAVQYLVFEMQRAGGRFDERAARIRQIVELAQWPQLHAVAQVVVADRAELRERLREVLDVGGEGLMLHRADAPNLGGRSEVLLKLKPVHDDDAQVIGYTPGQGRLAGMLGALQVRNADGVVFLVGAGFTDEERRAPPPVGSLIVYRFRGQTSHGVPRFASFVRRINGL